jgi:hypothetical protein
VHDQEEQVRELLKYECEFQRIAAEVGRSDVLEDSRVLLAADTQAQGNDNKTPHSRPH